MSKSEINTNWFKKTPVFCEAKPIGFVSSTKQHLNVDVWLSKHPFYTNSQTIIDTEGRVERFMKKYGLK